MNDFFHTESMKEFCNLKKFEWSVLRKLPLNLHQMAFAIFSICLKARIELDIQWISRFLNEKADYLSKIIDYDDWEITPQLFRLLEEKFGPHTVDCFADYNNCKLQIFYSRF